ncbi:MBL fold metallo-hydrolase [Pseudahrensia aquimaris]|uniref:MBL fold metallo-hydrolase n=1 Tax=Pseudahrensia aquimaris TaxID=744461 RepID=A0ABW3FEJ1_9HYPH
MEISLRFCGAAQTVTGSCYWLKTPTCSFLVDCGLFQGPKTVKSLNYEPFPFDASKIDFVLQTHAHIDHSGLLPKLSKAGFNGSIHATAGTRDLLTFMLPDSGYIQEMEVANLNRRKRRHGKKDVEPIYTQQDAEAVLHQVKAVEYEKWISPGEGVRARFWNAGHILGSASIEVEIETGDTNDGKPLRLLFSGDLGPDNKLFHPDPDAPTNFDYVISEATYGGKARINRNPKERRDELGQIARHALENGEMLLIPIFAVERTQELIMDLLTLQEAGEIPKKPIFLDSPLAIRVTRVFEKHADDLEELSERPQLLANPNVYPTETVEQSKAIDRVKGGAIILAASGMCDAGRIRHHLKKWLWQKTATVLFVGYQVPGTLGSLLVGGVKMVKIHGEEIRVQAKIENLDIYSGHADGEELVSWVNERKPIHRAIFLTHGEEESIEAMKTKLVERGLDGERILCPKLDDEVELLGEKRLPRFREVERRLPPETPIKYDWHNDLAQFSFDLREAFEQAADDKARAKFIRKLRRALELDATDAND